ncbi:MAG: glycosyltransferase family 2 protein [Candidatus Omnitrophica bacterium]|nr:glycosyltransferase family 2 protein [Candidatus Omnitrophota bacterium]
MISVIIVNYNRKDLLRQCLDSVRGQSFQDIETIVVDNASTDGSIEMADMYYSAVNLIRNTSNLLFCKAQNQGIEASKGNFILCLNSDCVLDKDYLKQVLSAIGLDTRIGMVSGKILRMNRKTIDSAGLFLGRNRKPVERGYGKKDKGQYDEPGYVFGASGACAFLRKSMLKNIRDKYGYFDERFGMYYEDLDLCWRAQKKGWESYYNPKALAYHMRGGTAVGERRHCEVAKRPKQSQERLLRFAPPFLKKGRGFARNDRFGYLSDELKKRYIANRYLCMRKNDSLRGILLNLPFIILYEIKIWGYMLVVKKLLDLRGKK